MHLSSDLATSPTQPLRPRYDGRSILNLVTSLVAHFGVHTGHAGFTTPLPLDGVQTVVLFVADGLGHYLLDRHLRDGDMPHLAALLEGGEASYSTATSTFPSSTMIAMTTLHTAATPAQHGWLGTSIHAQGSVVDVLRQRDLLTAQALETPESLTSVGSIYRRLTDAGVAVRTVSLAAFEGSFLNDWYFDGSVSVPYEDLPDLPEAVARAAQGGGPRYVLVYWPGFDAACHGAGPSSTAAAEAARNVDAAFHAMLEQLPRDESTLVVLTADHGQIDTPTQLAVALHDDPGLQGVLAGAPAGENLVRYLKVLPGREGELAQQLEGVATLLRSSEAWGEGLFGGSPAQEAFLERTGEWIAVAHPHHQLTRTYPAEKARVWAGAHGGWMAELMLVPIVAVRR